MLISSRLTHISTLVAYLTAGGTFLFTQDAFSQNTAKQKTPAQVSAEAAEEDPSEIGMEEPDDKGIQVQDSTGSAAGIGLDRSPLGSGGSLEDEADPTEGLEEAADDILDRSFSQPGVNQDTGHSRKKRVGGAKVAVPEQKRALPGVELEKKKNEKKAPGENKPVVIKNREVILKIQNALIRRGAKIKADGVMGKSTIDALKDFQEENKLNADGNPDPATLTKLGIIYIGR